MPPNIVIILTIIYLALNCNDVYFDRAVMEDDGNSADKNQEEFINLRNSITSCIAELDGSPDRDYSTFRIDCLYHPTLQLANFFELDDSVIQLISDARDILFERNADAETVQTITSPQLFTGEPGRPKFVITEEILRFLFGKWFTVSETVTLLGVSKRTVERRMNEFGVRIGECYSNIADNDLESVVYDLVRKFPYVGYKRMTGLLLARGLRIQQNRIRETMRKVDPHGTLFWALSLRPVQRRRYHVPSPLSLWHIDGNHKLIRLTKEHHF